MPRLHRSPIACFRIPTWFRVPLLHHYPLMVSELQPLVIIGARGHAAEVLEVVLCATRLAATHTFAGFIASNSEAPILGHPILGDDSALRGSGYDVLIGVNDSGSRARIDRELRKWGLSSPVALHVDSTIGPSVHLGPGVVVAAGGRIGLRSTLDRHVHVGCNVVVGHGCTVGSHTSILPGAVISGDVRLADRVQVGAGAVIRQGVTVNEDAIVGAGAVVIEDVESGAQSSSVSRHARDQYLGPLNRPGSCELGPSGLPEDWWLWRRLLRDRRGGR